MKKKKKNVKTGAPDIIGKNRLNVESVCTLRAQFGMNCRGCQFYKTGSCDAYGKWWLHEY